MENQKPCYGNLFPDPSHRELNQPLEGRAFTVLLESRGIGAPQRTVRLKPQEWAECVRCERYHDCYELSMAKLLLFEAF